MSWAPRLWKHLNGKSITSFIISLPRRESWRGRGSGWGKGPLGIELLDLATKISRLKCWMFAQITTATTRDPIRATDLEIYLPGITWGRGEIWQMNRADRKINTHKHHEKYTKYMHWKKKLYQYYISHQNVLQISLDFYLSVIYVY